MKLLCLFFPHKWKHVIYVPTYYHYDGKYFVGEGLSALYQCTRCKKIDKHHCLHEERR